MRVVLGLVRKAKWSAFRAVERLNRWASKVATTPFLSQAEFAWVAKVEAAADQIRAELHAVQSSEQIPNFQDISRDQVYLTSDDRWKTFFLAGYGIANDHNRALCPATAAVLDDIPGMQSAMFSILAPGKEIPLHRGPYNGVLRYHLGLEIPDDGETSGITVGGETRHWRIGESLIFDDTYDHEAWNHSEQQRVVLFVDFVRPLRTPVAQLNHLALAAIRRSRFVKEALGNLERHQQDQESNT